MSQITDRTPAELAELTASYMRRDKAVLVDLCTRLGLPTTGTKAQLVAQIVAKSSKIVQEPPQAFDFTGLHIPRLNITVTERKP